MTFKAEELKSEKLSHWNKPAEWDAKLGRSFIKIPGLFLKPMKEPEGYFFAMSPKEKYQKAAPKDVDPRSDKVIKDVMNYANCPIGLRPLIPKFHGFKSHKEQIYIAMDDMMYGMKHPCMCDIKLGTREHDPFANTQKIKDTEKRFLKREEYGFRVVGLRYFSDPKTVVKKAKTWGSTLTDWNEGILKFGTELCSNLTKKQQTGLLRKLKIMDEFYTKFGHDEILLFSTSLMIVFDKTFDGNDEDLLIRVKLIDFAHSFYKKDHPDVEDGVLKGIRNVRRVFMKIIDGKTGELGDGPKDL